MNAEEDHFGSLLDHLTNLRQSRAFSRDPVPRSLLRELFEIVRWTGSAKNLQPWHLILIDDPAILGRLAELRSINSWIANAPQGIAIVLDGPTEISEAYDEGRVTERLMLAARVMGLAAGTAWYGDPDHERTAKQILNVPSHLTARSIIALGYPTGSLGEVPETVVKQRKRVSDIVSHNAYGLQLEDSDRDQG